MAQSTLAVFSSSLFPQLINSVLGHEIARVDRILSAAELPTCCHESPESTYGACDGGAACLRKGIVHHLASGLEFCGEHFVEVDRG